MQPNWKQSSLFSYFKKLDPPEKLQKISEDDFVGRGLFNGEDKEQNEEQNEEEKEEKEENIVDENEIKKSPEKKKRRRRSTESYTRVDAFLDPFPVLEESPQRSESVFHESRFQDTKDEKILDRLLEEQMEIEEDEIRHLSFQETCSLPRLIVKIYEAYADCRRLGFIFPTWLVPENIRDSKNRSPSDPDYDVSSLKVPDFALDPELPLQTMKFKDNPDVQDNMKHLTKAFRQFWSLKSRYFDQIVFFKVGKFYELFYYDAYIGAEICELRWMQGKPEPHVGFPESALEGKAESLIRAGYKVCVVEQVETAQAAAKRSGKTTATVNRDVCQVYTPGTLCNLQLLEKLENSDSCYLLSVVEESDSVSLCVAECSTNSFILATCETEMEVDLLLLSYPPTEIITSTGLSALLKDRIQSTRSPIFSSVDTEENLESLKKRFSKTPEILKKLCPSEEKAVSNCLAYLEENKLDEIFVFSTWRRHKLESSRMTIDFRTAQSLELFDADNSVLSFLNRTSFPSGFRLLKKWILSPSNCVEEIEKRLDAVEFFVTQPEFLRRRQEELKKCGDVERKMAEIQRTSSRLKRVAVLYSDVVTKKLNSFLEVLSALDLLKSVVEETKKLNSPILVRQLCSKKFKNMTEELRGLLDVRTQNGRVKIRPKKGADSNYDGITEKEENVNKQLNEYLGKLKKKYGCELKYVHAKYLYEVECEDNQLPQSFLKNCDVTSKIRGAFRFRDKKIVDYVLQLQELDNEKEEHLYPFMASLFSKFSQKIDDANSLIATVAELDVLFSLARVSSERNFCRPVVVDSKKPFFEVRKSRHPVLEKKITFFVPNDIDIGKKHSSCLLISGPNMGGKSTILRQTCLLVILAQIGCFVPAEFCSFSVVDRIFSRLGANDRILEGKSTFYVEMEETAEFLNHATEKSLIIVDELGRGTSTVDGTALARACLDYVSETIKARCLFTTHYHKLTEEKNSRIDNFYLSFNLENENEVRFRYEFREGVSPSSYGMNVARLAGLPQHVIEEALEMSEYFAKNFQ